MIPYKVIRAFTFLILTSVIILKRRSNRGKVLEEIEDPLANFEKDENGLYPWENNTDDSPKSIPANAKRFHEKNKIRRGRW